MGAHAGDAGHILIDQGALAFGSTRFGEVGAAVAPARIVSLAADAGVLPAPEGNAVSFGGIAAVDRAWDRLGERLSAGDCGAARLAARVGAAMGRAAVTVVNLLDLDRVVFGGPFWSRIVSAALPAAASVVSSPSVFVEAVKLAEGRSGDVVVRLYEAQGARAADVAVEFGFDATSVVRTDLLERPLPSDDRAAATWQDANRVTLTLRPFEIVTLRCPGADEQETPSGAVPSGSAGKIPAWIPPAHRRPKSPG